jgi:hypothetical protein
MNQMYIMMYTSAIRYDMWRYQSLDDQLIVTAVKTGDRKDREILHHGHPAHIQHH